MTHAFPGVSRPTTLTRSIAAATLLGVTLLVSPSSATRAVAEAQAPAAETGKHETVEQRISTLHADLKITADEETKWNSVAQAMRENEVAMQKLAADQTKTAPQDMTAVDDLNTYERFAQAHVDGLKNLITSFDGLYAAMPDAQKKLADQVFQTFGRKGGPAHG